MKILALTLASLFLALPSAPKPRLGFVANVAEPGTINSDLAFWGQLAFQGSYTGFRVIDLADPHSPVVLADVKCNGPQGDVSVWGPLVFVSVDKPQSAPTCDSQDAADPTDPAAFEGIRIFDVSDPRNPRFVTAVATDCGSHTNTLVPDVAHGRVLLYVSSYALQPGPHCGPGREADPLHHKLSIVEIPLAAPETARVIATPRVDAPEFKVPNFDPTVGCHDITVFLPLHRAAASCMTEGQIWDISNPEQPRVLVHIRNSAFSFWHSAAFTWDGKYVVFGDESFPGSCNGPAKNTDGRFWIYRLAAPAKPISSFVIPRRQPGQVCPVHMFDVVPVHGRYLLASAWYEGGADLVDFTDPSHPRELTSFDAESNDWSAYWYDGYVYASDILRGLDVLSLTGVSGARTLTHLNPQTQEIFVR